MTRDQYPAHTLAALDEIAQLLQVALAAHGMFRTWKNAQDKSDRDLDVTRDRPKVRSVIRGSRHAAQALLDATFRSGPDKIVEARAKHIAELERALKCARKLADMEERALALEKSGVFRMQVVRPLNEIVERWTLATT